MSLIVLASDKGSPGVTTTAVALAGVWPRRAILAECDPSGGDLVYRIPAENGVPLNPNIGMLSLATTARHGLSPHQLEQHLQRMHGGLELVTGLATGDQSAGLAGLWPALGRAFAGLPEADVIADCGRLDATGPVLDLMAAATLVVLVARTSAEQIAHVRDRALSLLQRVGGGTTRGGLGMPIGVVLIVDPKQRVRVTAQVDELLRNSGLPVRVIGTLADDPDGADLINGRGRGRLDRKLLIRSTREVAMDLYRRYAMPSHGTAMAGPGATPMPGPGGASMPPQQQYNAPPMQQTGPPPGPPRPQPVSPLMPPQHTAPGMPPQPTAPTAPTANGYTTPAMNPSMPPAPDQPNQPMYRRDAPQQPRVWPAEQPPPQPASAHEGFTTVTFGGDPAPRPGAPERPDDDGSDTYRFPARREIGPGPSGYQGGPPPPNR